MKLSVALLAGILVTLTTGAVAQHPDPSSLRMAPNAVRLDTRPLPLPETRYRIAIADSVRRPSYWREGFWMGAATGAALGVLVAATYGYEGKVTTKTRIRDGLLTTALVGAPLAVLGAFIGDAFKKPISSGAAIP